MTRAVSVLTVASPALWDELDAIAEVTARLHERLSPTEAVVDAAFEQEVLPELTRGGAHVLVRYARQAPVSAGTRDALAAQVGRLPREARELLYAAQRHALAEVVVGSRTWDPVGDARWVDALHGAGLIAVEEGASTPRAGRYRLTHGLPPPPSLVLDLDEALMEPPDDLDDPPHGAVGLLHDLAILAAALVHVPSRRTHAGTIERAAGRRLGARLCSPAVKERGALTDDPRWARALTGLEAFGAVAMDPVSRQLRLDPHIELLLEGEVHDAADRLVQRLVEADLHPALQALRLALAEAGEQAVDEVVFVDLLREQHRDLLFRPWDREGTTVYPVAEGQPPVLFDDEAWERIEQRLVSSVLRTTHRLGLIRRAPGVFAATADGKLWAGYREHAPPPLWISSDLEVVVPPDAITPGERFQLETLGRCVARDVVDRYTLTRKGLNSWLRTHQLEDAVALLHRRCPRVPQTVLDTLASWAASATRVVLTRGVLLDAGEVTETATTPERSEHPGRLVAGSVAGDQ